MKLIPAAVAVLAAALTLVNVAAAQTLPTPPPPGGPTSSAIFDAMLAVARAASSNPAAAQSAAFSYQAAIQQYNVGDYDRARMSAIAAIGAAMPAPPLPAPSIVAPSIPQPVYYQMPLLVASDQADAEGYLGLARRSMITCGTAGPNPAQVQQQYAAAAAALDAKNYGASVTASQVVINYCASANEALAVQAAAAPQAPATPIAMTSYKPIPLATLGPDPALAQTPTPEVLPATPAPAPARHGFRL
jgi:hypothetical protein